MPKDKNVEFVAIDEIQMCADRERGHIFTERMLESRGSKLTMFLGSQIMKKIISELVSNIEFEKKIDFQNLVIQELKNLKTREKSCNNCFFN